MSALIFPRKHARHAKPAAAPKVLVAGGMTAAFAVTDVALMAGSASAGGSVAQFERLAQCESGGRWNINTGNGYYGGLQFNLATWRGIGMSGYPHQASKATQIAAGQKLHSQRGWQPWPACSRKLGLRGDGGYSGSGDVAAAKAPATPKVSAKTIAERRAAAQRASRNRAAKLAAQQAARAAAQAAAKAAAQAAAQAAAARLAAAKVAAVRLETALQREQLLVPMPGATEAALALPAAPTTPQFDGRVLTTADRPVRLAAVETWQRRMEERGWDLAVDGHFGPQSARVAALFAREKGAATPPGTVDQQLWDLAWLAPVTR